MAGGHTEVPQVDKVGNSGDKPTMLEGLATAAWELGRNAGMGAVEAMMRLEGTGKKSAKKH